MRIRTAYFFENFSCCYNSFKITVFSFIIFDFDLENKYLHTAYKPKVYYLYPYAVNGRSWWFLVGAVEMV